MVSGQVLRSDGRNWRGVHRPPSAHESHEDPGHDGRAWHAQGTTKHLRPDGMFLGPGVVLTLCIWRVTEVAMIVFDCVWFRLSVIVTILLSAALSWLMRCHDSCPSFRRP